MSKDDLIPRSLRVVPDGAGPDTAVAMDQAIASAAARIAALRPSVVLMVWEKPDGTAELITLPKSQAVAKGLVLAAYAAMFPDMEC